MKKFRREIKEKDLRFIHITKVYLLVFHHYHLFEDHIITHVSTDQSQNAGTTIEEVSVSASCSYGSCSGWGRHDEELRELGCSVPMRPLGYTNGF